MSIITRGFHERRQGDDARLPPGQYLTENSLSCLRGRHRRCRRVHMSPPDR
jgi:hypothetical protein